jgi:endonuclease III-like uncharacterized protein
MKIKLEDLELLLEYINTQSVYITDDYCYEMEEEMGKKQVKKKDKIIAKISKKIELEKQKIKE